MSPRRARHATLTRLLIATVVAVCHVWLVAPDAAAQAARYTVTDLGAFEPRGVNDVGQVAGRAFVGGREFAVLHDGTFKTVNPPGSSSAEAWSVNNRGQAVGSVFTCDIVDGNCVNGRTRAFIYRLGSFTILGTLGGGGSTGADIDEAGRAFGTADLPRPSPNVPLDAQAFATTGGALENLGTRMGVEESRATAVSPAGRLTGFFRNGNTDDGMFLYDSRDGSFKLISFNLQPWETPAQPADVNDQGQIVGHYGGNDDGSGRAFLYDANSNTKTDLGKLLPAHTYSRAWAVNNAGQIVGVSSVSWFTRQDEHAFVYEGGVMRDLNALIPAGSGWVLNVATDINAHGQIVGTGRLNGQERAFLLTPTAPLVLLTEPDSDKALAFDSVTFERDAFTLTTPRNFSADGRRRVTLLARNVELAPGETAQQVVVRAEDARGQVHQLPVEHVARVRGFPSFAQITVRLIDALAPGGDFQLSVSFRGATSNKATVTVKQTP